MKRQTLLEILVFVAIVIVGVQLRIALQALPNFAPVAAIALFSGYFFRSRAMALLTPLSIMAISDVTIGGYDWYMMALVYGMLALPVVLRDVLRRTVDLAPGKLRSAVAPLTALMACSLLGSVLFFLVTNFGSWMWFGMYERSLAGLIHCYAMALPFFRYTLAGDMAFGLLLFGGYALAVNRGVVGATWKQPAPALG